MERKTTKPQMRPPTDDELKELLKGLVEQSRKANPAQVFKFVSTESNEKE